MKISDLFSLCLRNLFRRKVRTLLTVMGVVVGTCAIVVMISIGIGLKQSQEALLAQMGDLTIIDIYNYGRGDGNSGQTPLDDAALTAIQSMNNVVAATPFYQPYSFSMRVFSGQNDRYVMYFYNLVGVYPEALPLLGYELLEGSFLDGSVPYSILFGQYAAYEFQDSKKRSGNNWRQPEPDMNGVIQEPFVDLMGDKLILRPDMQKDGAKPLEYKLHAAGILKEDWGRGYETSRGAFIDIAEYKKLVAEYNKANGIKDSQDETSGYERARVKVSDIRYVSDIQAAIEDMGYNTYSMENIRKPMEEQANKQQMILGSLGAISLFVAALGITNTMVMSIYERTREIGIMKVVGCFVNDIRTLFLLEAGFIGLFGGVAGVGLSYLISFLMNTLGFSFSTGDSWIYGMDSGGQVSVIPLWRVGAALAFSICIGLASGFYPANRAVKISALEAIKHE
jgi:ABC-type antimicrobial peptide transport system permease subunit